MKEVPGEIESGLKYKEIHKSTDFMRLGENIIGRELFQVLKSEANVGPLPRPTSWQTLN